MKDLLIKKEMNNDESDYLKKDGVLKRVNIPQWVAKAVFFRERGRCAFCDQDLSGIFSTQPESHLDHIVPLNLGGINDISNIQLLCKPCNLSKSGIYIRTSNRYETWYKK